MPVAIDTSVLIEAERLGTVDAVLPREEDGPFYIPALAAAEFLLERSPRFVTTCDTGRSCSTRVNFSGWWMILLRQMQPRWPRSRPTSSVEAKP